MTFHRPQHAILANRLREPRRFIQVVAGPRQVGKTTLVQQVCAPLTLSWHYASADEPTLRGGEWIAQQWDLGRLRDRGGEAILVLDEVQKIPGWSEAVKRLWDEDARRGTNLKAVLLGSAPLLLARGLTESLAGRFEVIRLPHWSAREMREAFGWSVEQWIFYGGYPGAAPLIGDHERWVRYVRDALIEPTLARDVLLLTRVDKPALLRRLFELGCRHSGQILSYTKMIGQLQDAGNTTTLAHYLDLLGAAGMLTGLPKYAGDAARVRGSSPKLQVLDNGLVSALAGISFGAARADHEHWGRLTESAIGAHLAAGAAAGGYKVCYWRERNHEVDFVVRAGRELTAIEVKSGRAPTALIGMKAFDAAWKPTRKLLVGGSGIPIDEFLLAPPCQWVGGNP